MPSTQPPKPNVPARSAELSPAADEPPVVARVVLEIRSDGVRTIARGAMEDATNGKRTMIAAEGTTPLALAGALARSMFAGQSFAWRAGRAVRALLGGGRRGE